MKAEHDPLASHIFSQVTSLARTPDRQRLQTGNLSIVVSSEPTRSLKPVSVGTRRAVGAGSINGVSPLFFMPKKIGQNRTLKLRLVA
jgi:hypothetical protein